MKGSVWQRWLQHIAVGGFTLAAGGALGCSAIVGSECAPGYTRCGRMCIDLMTNRGSCGACGNLCPGTLACVGGMCVAPVDAGPDASMADAAVDAGRDAGPDAARDASADAGDASTDSGATDANLDASLDASLDADLDAGPVDGGPPICGIGLLSCPEGCIDPTTDTMHCGSCTTVCGAGEVCAGGTCQLTCDPLTTCGSVCADITSDPDHCGNCTTSCGSGICNMGVCEAAIAGHLVVIGHDFENRRAAMSTLLANAVLLGATTNVRILVWQGTATAACVTGTMGALTDGAAGRTFALTTVSDPAEVPLRLDSTDTFLVLGQAGTSDTDLMALGTAWGTALTQFLHRGGVVVVEESPTLMNRGTYQILQAAGLFDATSRSEFVTPRLSITRASDPVLVGVPLSYRGELHTSAFVTLDPDAIVTSTSGPVVFDRAVTP